MKRKRVVIVTGNQRVAQAIFSDVKAVFNNDVDIDIVYPSQIASLDAVEADAFLVTRWYNIGGLTDMYPANPRWCAQPAPYPKAAIRK